MTNNRFLIDNTSHGESFIFDGNDLEVFKIDLSKRGVNAILKDIEALKCTEKVMNTTPCTNDAFQKNNLRIISINMNDGCTLSCKYCYITASGKKAKHLSIDTASSILDYLSEIKDEHLCFSFSGGGEPTLNFKTIKQFPALCKAKGFANCEYEITTNGTLLAHEALSFLKDNGFNVYISIDGDENNNANRVFPNGRSSFNQVLKTLQACKDFGLNFTCKAVIQPSNENLLPVFSFFEENDFPFVFGFATESIDHRYTPVDCDVSLFQNQIGKVLDYYYNLIAQNKKVYALKIINDLLVIHKRLVTNIACMASRTGIYIDMDGKIYPCSYFTGVKPVGDINSGIDYKKVLKDSLYAKSVETKPVCQDCWAKFLCAGSCMALRWSINNNMDAIIPSTCNVNKAYWNEIIKLYVRLFDVINSGKNVNFS